MEISVINVVLFIKNESQIIVPSDKNGFIKVFQYKCLTEELNNCFSDNASNDKFNFLHFLTDNIYFLNFLVQLGFEQEVFIVKTQFNRGGITQEYSFLDEDYIDGYWIDHPKNILDEEFVRSSIYGYSFDEYEDMFGMNQSNYEFTL
jgi:hypothetical protein